MPWQATQVADLVWPALASPGPGGVLSSASSTICAGAGSGAAVTSAAGSDSDWAKAMPTTRTPANAEMRRKLIHLLQTEGGGAGSLQTKPVCADTKPRNYPRRLLTGQRNAPVPRAIAAAPDGSNRPGRSIQM